MTRHRHEAAEGEGARRVRRPSFVFALLACWALLLQGLIPLVHTPPARAATDGIPSWVLASLCLGARGVSEAPIGPAGDPAKQLPTDNQPVCPICLGLHQAGTFTQPGAIDVPAPSVVGAVAFVATQPLDRPGRHRGPALARAPPAIA
jgi:hypothetical protein